MCISEPATKIWLKVDPYYRQQKCRPMTLVSSGIRFMRIFAEVPWGRSVKRHWVVENCNFQRFPWLFFSEALEIRPALLYSDTQSVVSFLVIPKCMTLNGYFALNSVLRRFCWLRPCDFRKVIKLTLMLQVGGNLPPPPQTRFSHHCTKTAWNFFGTLPWLFLDIYWLQNPKRIFPIYLTVTQNLVETKGTPRFQMAKNWFQA